jgi:hypothetical protein
MGAILLVGVSHLFGHGQCFRLLNLFILKGDQVASSSQYDSLCVALVGEAQLIDRLHEQSSRVAARQAFVLKPLLENVHTLTKHFLAKRDLWLTQHTWRRTIPDAEV